MNVAGRRRGVVRSAAVAATVAVCFSAGVATADVVSTRTTTVAAARATVTSCGALSSVVVNYAVTAGAITKVLLTGIPAACAGGQLSLTLNQSGTDIGHAGPTTVVGTTMTMPLSATPSATSVTDARIGVTGP